MNNDQWFTTIPTLETERYILRGIQLEDASRLFPFLRDKETMKNITAHPVQSEEEVRQGIIDSLAKFDKQQEIPWVIIHKKNNDLVGQFRLHKLSLWHQKAEMGAVIREDYQNKGVMTEIIKVLLPFVFDTLRLHRLVGDIFARNDGSRKLLEKFGFTKEGVLRDTDYDGVKFHDTVVYSMLREEYEWKKNNA
ncbi:GNAT family N-acetyltransferase [Ornithinibacillus massiliensis]|uniref:GNAT family N-acetyltransferase n=1 Tax=Ornithinibacillus massiliensis TaxID=1944633 RepID=A0ABS5MAS4_9BACI|nr:GNAT family N-acetyltransferase [Ornithinibacillus massiliensis]MBS3679037.1 GNAT family N-acetyltransferase [Ornithinibacillus massiliensis]